LHFRVETRHVNAERLLAAEGGGYSGRMLVDGEILTPAEATKKFLRSGG
jgi:hypothetical protein